MNNTEVDQPKSFNHRARRATHPITGRIDKTRTNPQWRERVQQIENSLGYVICGAYATKTGEPCMSRPMKGQHRCVSHTPKSTEDINSKKNRPYPSNVGYGMNLNMFVRCRRCKDEHCPHRIDDIDSDECVIEKDIYAEVMGLSEKYKIDRDVLQGGMLESVAFLFIKRFRAEKAIAKDGMTYEEIVGFDPNGGSFKNKKPHPLLKSLSDINRELNTFSKSLQFSPEAQTKLQADEDMQDSANIIAGILKNAHRKRQDTEDNEQ